jgi:hypothetical protein
VATRIWTLIGIMLLISAAVASPLWPDQASAHGTTRVIVDDVQEGPYLFRVGIIPGSPKIGNLHLSVLIQAAEGDEAITDGRITVMATGPGPGMIAGPVEAANEPLNPQVYSADLSITDLGTWSMTLETTSALGEATLVVPLQVTESGGFNLLYVIVIAVVVSVSAVAWSQIQRRRQST